MHWSNAYWDEATAIRRQEDLLASYLTSSCDSLEDYEIPWPILHRPLSYFIENITSDWVSAFFVAIHKHPNYSDPSEIRRLIKRCFLCFHPDKLLTRLRVIDSEADRQLVRNATKVIFLELQHQLTQLRGEDL